MEEAFLVLKKELPQVPNIASELAVVTLQLLHLLEKERLVDAKRLVLELDTLCALYSLEAPFECLICHLPFNSLCQTRCQHATLPVPIAKSTHVQRPKINK